MTVPMMPSVGAKPPAVVKRLPRSRVARRHAVDLRLEDRVHEVGVGAVDDELQALARERVVDLGDVVLEREQAVAARLLGQLDHLADGPGRVDRRCRLNAMIASLGHALHRTSDSSWTPSWRRPVPPMTMIRAPGC